MYRSIPKLMIAAVATGSDGLKLVDVSDPMMPRLIASVDVDVTEVEVIEGVAYTFVGTKVVAYDLKTGDLLDKTLPLISGSFVAMDRDGSVLYLVDSDRVLHVVDASEFNLQRIGTLELPKLPNELFAGGGVVYAPTIAGVGLGRGGYMTVDVSDPSSPVLVADTFANDAPLTGSGIDFASNGAGIGLVLGGPSGGQPNVIDVFDTTAPFRTIANSSTMFLDPDALLTRFVLPDTPRALEIASGVAYTAVGNAGIVVANFKSFDSGGVAPTVSISSSIDVDPVTPGIQIEEGKFLAIQVDVSDVDNGTIDPADVSKRLARLGQVRSVELLVNGEVVRNDVSFPFEDFSIEAPRLNDFDDPITVQVRATDTGGNVGLSEPLIVRPFVASTPPAAPLAGASLASVSVAEGESLNVVDVVPDITPPELRNTNPQEGGVRSKRFRTLRLGFNESMDPSTLTAANFRLVGPDADPVDILSSPAGNVFPLIDLQARKQNTEIQLTYARFVPGEYELFVNQAAVTDAAGNPLGNSEQVLLRFTVLDADSVFVNPLGGAWTEPDNWDTGEIPRPGDEVHLATDAGSTVILNGLFSLKKLTGLGNVSLSSGVLDVEQTIELDGDLVLAGGTVRNATLLGGGNGRGVVGTSADGALDNVTLNADGLLQTGSVITVRGGLELNGMLRIERTVNSSSNTYDTGLDFSAGSQLLSGTGEVELFSALTYSQEANARSRPTDCGRDLDHRARHHDPQRHELELHDTRKSRLPAHDSGDSDLAVERPNASHHGQPCSQSRGPPSPGRHPGYRQSIRRPWQGDRRVGWNA